MNIIACGALAHELTAIRRLNDWRDLNISCLPAHFHQTPQRIPEAVGAAIRKIREQNDEPILVAYGDCGTGGKLDEVLDEYGVERLPGAHCYEFFAGNEAFTELHEAEPGTFYLTDFLVRHFDTYVIRTLGLDHRPELRDLYFANYKKLCYLAQVRSVEMASQAEKHAQTLGLEYCYKFTGYGGLAEGILHLRQQPVPVPCPN